MKKMILATLLILSTALAGNATVLTFDEINTGSFTKISTGYGGFNWSNMYVENGTYGLYANTGYQHGVASGTNAVFDGAGLSASINTGSFDFNGAYLTGALRNGLSIEVDGFKNGVELYSSTVIVDSYAPTYFNFDYKGIDSLVFSTFGGTFINNPDFGNGGQFVLDNFTYNEPVNAPVPEPGTMMLLGLGMAGLAVYGKRRQNRNKA